MMYVLLMTLQKNVNFLTLIFLTLFMFLDAKKIISII